MIGPSGAGKSTLIRCLNGLEPIDAGQIWLDDTELTAGRADVRGHVVEVVADVRRADPEDGGGLTLRATELRVLAEDVPVEPPVHWRQVWVAAGLAVVAIVLVVRDRRRRR